ncbi:leucine-rich repeat domain-containing protein [Prevotella sp. E13-27]|uniref:leucine-rich repeat domain-containing protein n=1 Tax=Prevotella sp. E13-27 TaxID=2938122 RepID=UPI002009F55B|nr:leucine-rich repeat domain-containing protein [Prevotella sp. E13-27]MCK8621048.1 leucine-rich repeat domain-containing protein [Prevotella sp. E13-27]
MNKIFSRFFALIAFIFISSSAFAESFEVDGIYYEVDANNNAKVVKPSSGAYTGISYIIPSKVKYGNIIYNVTSIGSSAFHSCSKLKEIILPSSLNEIGDWSFVNCSELSPLVLPSSLEKIGMNAFQGCSALTEIVIPKSVKSIDSNPFVSCENLQILKVEAGNAVYDSRNDCNAILKGDELVAGCKSTVIPDGISKIGSSAFYALDIEGMVIPNSVVSIGSSAFHSCSKLKEIILPSSLNEIGDWSFVNCSELSPLVLPSSLEKIGMNAFQGCSALTEIVIPKSVKSIDSNPFVSCENLQILKVEAGNAVYDSRNDCNAILKGDELVAGCKSTVIPDGISKIGSSAFYALDIEGMVIPNSVVSIGSSAFHSCSKLKEIILPSSLNEIGDWSFVDCSELSKVTSLIVAPFEINSNVFMNISNNAALFVPENTKNDYMQYNGWTVNFLGIYEIHGEDIEWNFEVDGIYYEIDATNINNVKVTKPQEGKYSKNSYRIPAIVTKENGDKYNVVEIGNDAFSRCSTLQSITLPETVTCIGKSAFEQCSNLSSINLPNHLVIIDDEAFRSCSKVTSVVFPNTLKTIGRYAFYNTGLTSVSIPSSVYEIGSLAFNSCDNLSSITVESGNDVYNSKDDCNAIMKGTVLFIGCKNSTVPSGTTEIGNDAFSWCSTLQSITLPETVTCIGKSAFEQCSNLSSINLPNHLVIIDDEAFRSCRRISIIELPNTLDTIGSNAFYGCSDLVEIVSNMEAPFEIKDNVFGDYNNTIYSNATLYVPVGKVDMYKNLGGWKNFVKIQEIKPDPTPVIDGLTYVIHEKTKYAEIKSASSVDHIVIPTYVEYENVQYPVTRILDEAFMGNKMISLSIPGGISYVGQNVLKDCNQLAAILWNPSFKPSDEFVNHIANPNLLFYVAKKEYKPFGIRNVIVDNEIPDITLTDESIGNFYCPKAFTAANISYTHNFSLKTEKGKCQGWESIALPFDVTTYKTSSGDAIKPFKKAGTGEKLFWLRELTDDGLVEAEGIRANTPYIISMPNWEGYQDFYNITGYVAFSAQNARVEATDIHPIVSEAHRFYPAFQMLTKNDSIYALNQDDDNAPGSIFVKNSRDIRPFEAYFTTSGSAAARKVISISDLMEGTTAIANILTSSQRMYSNNGIIYIESTTNGNCNIYAVSGQLMRRVTLKQGTNTVEGLSKGIYIVNGQKIMVR